MILINVEKLHLGRRRISPNSKHVARIRSPKSLAPSQGLTSLFIKSQTRKPPNLFVGMNCPCQAIGSGNRG